VILSLVFAIAVFGYLGVKAYRGAQQLAQTGIHFTAGYLLLSLLCQSVGVLLAAAMWGDILRRMGVKASYLFDLQAFCASAVARKLPGVVWYAVSRLALYKLIQSPKRAVVLALIIEAIEIALAGLTAFGISLNTGLISLPGLSKVRYLVLLIPFFIVVVAWLQPIIIRFVVRRMKMKKGIVESQVAQLTSVRFGDTLRWLLGETGVIVLGAGVAFFLLKSIDATAPVPFTSVLGAWGLAVAIGPIAMWLPGDIGLKDGFMYLALSPLISGPLAAIVTLAWRFWVTFLEILFGAASGIKLSKLIVRSQKG